MTDRQARLLASIIEQYAEVASPVGSVTLAKLFDVSPATIRAEMARLEDMGYINQPHTSAGRVPTDKGYRYFVNQLKSDDKPVIQSSKTRVMDRRVTHAGEPEQAIKSAVNSLAELTNNAALATMGLSIYFRGFEKLFSQPEFGSTEAVQGVSYLIDHMERWLREAAPNQPLSVFIGHENPIGRSSEAALIISKFRSPYSDRSYIGVLGPTRQNYRRTMNIVKHTGQLLEATL
jgi:heat-inducible transcriptional repressor